MAKKLRVRDHFLLGLALAGDLLDQTVGKANWSYKTLSSSVYTLMPSEYKPANYYHSVWRMLKSGEVEKVIRSGKPYLRITSQGRRKIVRDFSLLKMSQQNWNQKWCLVIFDIEEKNKTLRESLRRKVTKLGFGQLQKSVYISPYDFSDDLAESFSEEKILGQVLVLICRHRLMGDPKKLAEKVWPLKELNRRYQIIFDRLKGVDEEKKEAEIFDIRTEILDLFEADPFLPKELLPNNWVGNKIVKLIGL